MKPLFYGNTCNVNYLAFLQATTGFGSTGCSRGQEMRLRDIATAFPPQRTTSKEIVSWTGGDLDFVVDKIGVRTRAFLREDESVVSLSQQACDKLFECNQQLARERVKLLVLVTQNPDNKLPHSSALLQSALSLDVGTACFDVSLGCSGYVYALSITKAFMSAEGITDGIVVTCDPYSKIMGKADRDTVSLFGDAATATWLSAEAGAEIGKGDYGTDGARGHNLMVKAGGSAKPLSSLWQEWPAETAAEDFRLCMNGRAIFNFMMARVPRSVKRCLDRNGLTMDSVDYFVFHQASKFMIENLRAYIGLDALRVPCDITETGNTVSSSIPIVLARMMDEGALQGKRVLLSGFGVGLSWATNILDFGGSE